MVAKAKAAPAATNNPSIGSCIDSLFALREQKRDLEAQIKELEERAKEVETQLDEAMQAAGVEKATGAKATASWTTTTVADVTDWDVFWPYVAKNKFFHLIQRRVSDPAYRELLEAGRKVPGVQPFPKRKLNLRAI